MQNTPCAFVSRSKIQKVHLCAVYLQQYGTETSGQGQRNTKRFDELNAYIYEELQAMGLPCSWWTFS